MSARCTCDEMHLRRSRQVTRGHRPSPVGGASGCVVRSPPTSNTRSFAKQSRKRVRANCEEYPPTEGRCRRQSLEWCRKAPSESNFTPNIPSTKQPYGLIFKAHIYPNGFVRLINDNLVFVRTHITSIFMRILYQISLKSLIIAFTIERSFSHPSFPSSEIYLWLKS